MSILELRIVPRLTGSPVCGERLLLASDLLASR